ncbi:MAG: alpha/beta hydrolase [Nakamurella sp.]
MTLPGLAEDVLLYPGDEPSSVDAFGQSVRAGRAGLQSLADAIAGSRSSLNAAWQGLDAAAADREIGSLEAVSRTLIQRADAAAAAVDIHHADLSQIRVSIAMLRDEWDSVRSRLATALTTPLLQTDGLLQDPVSSASPGTLFGQPLRSRQQIAAQQQAEVAGYWATLADLRGQWIALVERQEVSAGTCQSALETSYAGAWEYQSGTGPFRGELGTAVGLGELTFDDRERAAQAASGVGWDELSTSEQTFYRGLAKAEYTAPLVLGSKAMIPELWSALEPMGQQALIHDAPGEIGNTDGLPAGARDQANRISLTSILGQARADASAAGLALPGSDVDPDGRQDDIESALAAAGYDDARIRAVRGALAVDYQLNYRVPARSGLQSTPVDLLIFDPAAFDGAGRAAIALGDVSTAANVAMLVPGMTSEVPGYLGMQTGDAINLYQDAHRLDPSTAVVAYVGYQAPGMDLNVIDQDYSDAGGKIVAADIGGLGAMAGRADQNLTVIAHSYGSTTTSTAFAAEHAQADNLVLIGSPGAGRAETAEDLGLPPGHVFVGSASSDPVTTIVQQAQDPGQMARVGMDAGWHFGSEVGSLGPLPNVPLGALAAVAGAVVADDVGQNVRSDLGNDPAGQHFGAVRLHTETQNDDVYEFGNHSDYYLRGSESLANLASITAGHYDQLTIGDSRPNGGDHYTGVDPESAHQPPNPADSPR